jgi:hypothetical protein
MTDNRTTLLPCPFCGGEATKIAARQLDDGTYYPAACGCRSCGIWCYGDTDYGHGGFATEEDCKVSMEQAVSKWNTRTPEQAIAATLGSEREKALEKLVQDWQALYEEPDYGDCCSLRKRMQALGIEVVDNAD